MEPTRKRSPVWEHFEMVPPNKVKCLVTDAAANMTTAANILQVRHAVCLAHALNLIVKKSMDATPGLDNIRSNIRRMVIYSKSSTTAKEKLQQIQVQMGRLSTKLKLDVHTRWNSTYEMLQRFHEQRDAVAAALTTLPTDLHPLTANEFECASQCIKMLSPSHAATVELSHEKRVSGSKVIPLIRMLKHTLTELMAQNSSEMATNLGINLTRILNDKLSRVETTSDFSLASLLDPRCKTLRFQNCANSELAVRRLKSECAALMRNGRREEEQPSTSRAQPEPAASSQVIDLWKLLDSDAEEARASRNATAEAIVEVQSYLSAPPLERSQDPLVYWTTHKAMYPNLYHLANQYLAAPASSVPCERVFSKAGEIVSKKRNRLKPSTVEKLLFLNKNA